MRWVLTAGLLVLLLSVWVAPVGAQTQGPGPGEVPSELWKKYPLKKPRAAPRQESAKHQSRRPPEARAIDQKTGDGAQDTSFFVVAGLLLLVVSAILMTAARRRVVKRVRTEQGGSATTGGRLEPGSERVRAASGRSEGRPVAPGRLQRPAAGESPAAGVIAPAARELRSPAPPRPRPAPMQSRMATGRDVHAQATLSRQPALGYASAPAEGDDDSLMRRQQREIEAVCGRKGLGLLKLVRDIEARGGSDLSRPGLAYALERLAAHEASCLVVSSLERLTRSEATLGTLVEWLDRCGARLVVVDTDLDTGTVEGRHRAEALAAVASPERKTPWQRTRHGLDRARLAQRFSGQAVSHGPALKRHIADMRASGMTLQAIADTLNAEEVPTLRGGIRWRPSSVQAAAGYKRPTRKSG
jgi:DNA invertase Pin-like site-specific DNA recombinase